MAGSMNDAFKNSGISGSGNNPSQRTGYQGSSGNGQRNNNPSQQGSGYQSKSRSPYPQSNTANIDEGIQRILTKIENSKGMTLETILDPRLYALPVLEDGQRGWAFAVAKNLNAKRDNGDSVINSTQLRKIFAEIKNIERAYAEEADFQTQLGQIFLLMPQVAYAYSRGIVKKDYYMLMKALLTPERIKTRRDYVQFVKFYEAVIAYFKVEEV